MLIADATQSTPIKMNILSKKKTQKETNYALIKHLKVVLDTQPTLIS